MSCKYSGACLPVGHAHHGNPDEYVTYAGLTLKKAPGWEYALSKGLGGVMW